MRLLFLVPTLEEVFGPKPRVKLLEALVDLAPYKFTRPDLAGQAGLSKNVYREIDPVIADGLVRRAAKGRPARFTVNRAHLHFQLADLFTVIAQAADPSVRSRRDAARYLDAIWDAIRTASLPAPNVIRATNTGSADPGKESYALLETSGTQEMPASVSDGENHVIPIGATSG